MNTDESQKAMDLYKLALAKGDSEGARVYLLNALAHDPSMDNIKLYVNELKQLGSLERENLLPQAYEILSQAAITGPVENISQIQELIAQLQTLSDVPKPLPQDDGEEEKNLKDELESTSWKNLLEGGVYDSDEQTWHLERIEKRLVLLKRALESGLLDDNQAEQYGDELSKTELQLSFCSVSNEFYRLAKLVIGYCIIDGGVLTTELKMRVVANLQQMSSMLNQVLNMPDEGLDMSWGDYSISNCAGALIKSYRNVESRAQLAIGKDVFDEILDDMHKFNAEHESLSGLVTVHINAAQDFREKIVRRISEMPAAEHQRVIASKLKDFDKTLADWNKNRYARYQKWVADLCRKAVQKWDDTTMVSAKDAKDWIDSFNFAEIDESLLSPEAAGVFMSIKTRLMDKLSNEERANYDYKFIVSPKKRLESF